MLLKSLIFLTLLNLVVSHVYDQNCSKIEVVEAPKLERFDFEYPKINFILKSLYEFPAIKYKLLETFVVTMKNKTTRIIPFNTELIRFNPRELFLRFENNTLIGQMAEIIVSPVNVEYKCRSKLQRIEHKGHFKWLTFFEGEIAISGGKKEIHRYHINLEVIDYFLPFGPEHDLECVEIATYPIYGNIVLPKQSTNVKETTSFRLIHKIEITSKSGTEYKYGPQVIIELAENITKVVNFFTLEFESKKPRNLTISLHRDQEMSVIIGWQKRSSDKETSDWECQIKKFTLKYYKDNPYIAPVEFLTFYAETQTFTNYIIIEKIDETNGGTSGVTNGVTTQGGTNGGTNGRSIVTESTLLFVLLYHGLLMYNKLN